MNIEEIEQKIKELKDLKNKKFLTIDEKTDGFYNGKITVYEEWRNSLKK